MPLKEDDAFNTDDMMAIFGEKLDVAPAAAPKKTSSTPPPAAPAVSPASLQKEIENLLSDEEMKILEQYEQAKRQRSAQEQEARRQKEQQEQKIIEEYEKQKREAAEREERERKALEEKRQRELEALRQKQQQQEMEEKLKEEERRIIEEYERERQAKLAKEKAEQIAREEKAQAELKALAERQKAEEEKRQKEEQERAAKLEQELKAKAALDAKKESRLMELLAKAQQEIARSSPGIPPLPSLGSGSASPSMAAAATVPVASSPAGPSLDRPDDISSDDNIIYTMMFEEVRRVFFSHLAPLVGIKAANTMLTKTLEKARSQAPAVLKDVNWKMDGTLRDDGSIDIDRLFKNASSLPQGERVGAYFAGLKEVLNLRFKAVESGLGAPARNELMQKVLNLKTRIFADKGFKSRMIDLFYQEIVSS